MLEACLDAETIRWDVSTASHSGIRRDQPTIEKSSAMEKRTVRHSGASMKVAKTKGSAILMQGKWAPVTEIETAHHSGT